MSNHITDEDLRICFAEFKKHPLSCEDRSDIKLCEMDTEDYSNSQNYLDNPENYTDFATVYMGHAMTDKEIVIRFVDYGSGAFDMDTMCARCNQKWGKTL